MECCKYIGVVSVVDPNNFFERQFYETRGFKTIIKDGHLIIILPNICPHLTEKGCDIYSNRPYYCRMYDGRNDPFLKDKCLWKKGD